MGFIQLVIELAGLVRSPLAPLCTDGPCYALVVLLVGNSRDTPFCNSGVDRGIGDFGEPETDRLTLILSLPILQSCPVLRSSEWEVKIRAAPASSSPFS